MFLKILIAFTISLSAVSVGKNFVTANSSDISSVTKEKFCHYVSSNGNKKINNEESWTIMMYMLDGNGLSVESQIDEMISAGNIPNDVNVIIESNCDYYGDNDNLYLYRYILTSNGLYIDDVISRSNMGLESTFSSFLEWGLSYNADKVGLIFYDHGLAINGVCSDNYGLLEGRSDSLLVSETSRVYSSVFEDEEINKLEFVGYDACVMQLQDIAYSNSYYFNYMIASEEEEYISGWSYDEWLPELYNHESTITILEEIADSFVLYGSNEGDPWEQTMSILDLSEMPYYKTAFENLASAISTTVSQNRLTFEGIIQSCWAYGSHASGSSSETYELVDCHDLMIHMQDSGIFDNYSNYINAVIDALDDLVIYQITSSISGCGSLSHGLTVHYSLDHYSNSYPLEETYFTNWWSLFHVEHTHNHLNGYNSQYHFLRCDCGNVINANHDFARAIAVTEQFHVKLCDCGYYYIENHNMVYFNGHGQTILYCEDCNYIINLSN